MQSFANRDMIMRFIGGGIGHIATRAIVKIADTLRYFLKNTPLAALDLIEVNSGSGAESLNFPNEHEDLLHKVDEDEGQG